MPRGFEPRKRTLGVPSHLRPRKTYTWYVLGVKHTPFGHRFHFIDSKTIPVESVNEYLIPVFADDADKWDYVIVCREDLVYKNGWLKEKTP